MTAAPLQQHHATVLTSIVVGVGGGKEQRFGPMVEHFDDKTAALADIVARLAVRPGLPDGVVIESETEDPAEDGKVEMVQLLCSACRKQPGMSWINRIQMLRVDDQQVPAAKSTAAAQALQAWAASPNLAMLTQMSVCAEAKCHKRLCAQLAAPKTLSAETKTAVAQACHGCARVVANKGWKWCAGCQRACYCSQQCQTEHRSQHKPFCGAAPPPTTEAPVALMRPERVQAAHAEFLRSLLASKS